MALCFRSVLGQYFRRRPVRSYSTNGSLLGPRKGDRVVVGMSGGVDSSVTAKLLADQDYDLSAVFMRNWDTRDETGTDVGCEWEKDWEDVQRVCKALEIPCELIDLSSEYWNRVFEPALHQWESGVTPNPDVWCNKEIKFGALLERLPPRSEGAGKPWFATGHYARKSWSTHDPPRPKLLRGTDNTKDQSYYLSSISEAGLSRALFPLGEMTKVEVRALAKEHNLPTAERTESMGLCFVGEKSKFSNFISSYIPPNPGPIMNLLNDECVGEHSGLWNFTVGQKAKIPGMPEKMFVAKKDVSKNIIYVIPGSNHSVLYCSSISIPNFSWIWADSPPADISLPRGLRARAKIRHRMETVPCTVWRPGANPNQLIIKFDTPEKAVALGQVAALWDVEGEWVLGCGVIAGVTSSDA